MITLEVPKSSVISEVGYTKNDHSLFVKFKKGKSYRYLDVPEEVFNEIKSIVNKGESMGKYFTSKIKGKFTGAYI